MYMLSLSQSQAFHSRYAQVMANLNRPDILTVAKEFVLSRSDPVSGAPAGMEPPKSASRVSMPEARKILAARGKCSHRKDPVGKNANPAVRQYSAGRHGAYAQCNMCERKWHWSIPECKWLICQEEKLVKVAQATMKAGVKSEVKPELKSVKSECKEEPDAGTPGLSQVFSSPLPPTSSASSRVMGALGSVFRPSRAPSASSDPQHFQMDLDEQHMFPDNQDQISECAFSDEEGL